MSASTVSSIDDPRLADYAGLRDRDLRRAAEGLFVGEQLLVVERMLALPGVTLSVLCSERLASRVLAVAPDDVPVLVGSDPLLHAIAGFHVHRGVLAIGRRDRLPRPSLDELAGAATPAASATPRTLLACEDITHADNIGSLFRVAAALGAHGILLSPRCHDPLYRRCVRVSIGNVLGMPWRFAEQWPGDLDVLKQRHGFAVLGAALAAGAERIDRVEPPLRSVLVVGSEFGGLVAETAACCSRLVRIPMAAGVDSLNVAVAAAIGLDRLGRGTRA